eukprot:TRINITY_DN7906_c1_g1_i6.p1 TRINITY_DN7906_c1_g1~~TRINITY_DN7906_c1_g1_i6.p1  ORF type:complete len:266 (+),score=23.55 TRINITY_DN7906_c1_g1_i6:171-968(+)
MASLCGVFGLAIFLCLFYYNEALRRDSNVEALGSDESVELRQMSSDLVEHRGVRTNAKLDTSFVSKRGGEGGKKKQKEKGKGGNKPQGTKGKKSEGTSVCPLKNLTGMCQMEGLSPACCEQHQHSKCEKYKNEKGFSWTVCDKFKNRRYEAASLLTACNNIADILANDKNYARGNCQPKPTLEPTSACPLKNLTGMCQMEGLSPACCEQHQHAECDKYKNEKGFSWTVCDKFKNRRYEADGFRTACNNPADNAATDKNYALGNCH